MIPLLNAGSGGASIRRLVSSYDTSIVRSDNAYGSISRASSTDSAEIFAIPAGTLVAAGDFLLLDFQGSALNNTGSNKRLNIRLTLDAAVISVGNLGQVLATSANPRSWGYTARIRLSGESTANVVASQVLGNSAGSAALPQGTQYGDVTAATPSHMFARGVAFTPGSAHTLKVEATWDATDAVNLSVNPQERVLTATRYVG